MLRHLMLNRSVRPVCAISLHVLHKLFDINSLFFDDSHLQMLMIFSHFFGSISTLFEISNFSQLQKMKSTPERQTLSIKCECIITKNNIPINTKKNSKFSLITLDSQNNQISISPFGTTKSQQKSFKFLISRLRTIHKKYLEQGKMTLDFFQRSQKIIMKGQDVSAIQKPTEIFSTILISSASKQNLELMLKKIMEIKTKQNKNHKVQSNTKEPPKKIQIPSKRKPQILSSDDQDKIPKLSRQELKRKAFHPNSSKKDNNKIIPPSKKITPSVRLTDLPPILLDNVFQYCQLDLSLRLISKRFSTYVLENIHSIKLHHFVDEQSFNNLAKWAVNVECKMTRVKSIDLRDRFEHEQLIKNRAKTLKFGQWKQITQRNLIQMKGLKTYCIELPYMMKVQLSNLFGQRMVELRLKGPPNARNEVIKEEHILHIINNIKQLRVLQVPYCTSKLLNQIQNPQKMEQLIVQTVTDVSPNGQWTDISKFQNLKKFGIEYLQKNGEKLKKHELSMTFPENIIQLQIGSFLSIPSLEKLPLTLTYLRLVGQFYNKNLENIYLPNIKQLDVSDSKNIRPQVIEFLENITLITSWKGSTIDNIKKYAQQRKIEILTTEKYYS